MVMVLKGAQLGRVMSDLGQAREFQFPSLKNTHLPSPTAGRVYMRLTVVPRSRL